MQLLLRRALSAAASTGRLHRGFSTAPPRPPWAMIYKVELVKSPEPGTSFLQFKPPGGSILFVPEHFIDPQPRLHPDPKSEGVLNGMVQGTSGDGLLLLLFADAPATPAVAAKLRAARDGESIRPEDVDIDVTRFVCNPLSGEMFRLPDIDGMKKAHGWHAQGILTKSARGHGPPDRYAVAELSVDGEGDKRSFVMRRFFSETGEWDKLVGLPSPLPRPRQIGINHEVLAFDGRLWWVDLTWGAISADPFGDRPELRFVELPRLSVCPMPGTNKNAPQGMYRRMGVSEGRLRYVEVSQKEPFVLSSYTLDNDGGDGWTLEHQVALSRVFPDAGKQEGTPLISVIDPLNASFICVIIGNHSLAIDMDMGKVLDCVMIKGCRGSVAFLSPFIKPCALPPWLELSRIPSAGTLSSNNATVKSKTLADILVRADAN